MDKIVDNKRIAKNAVLLYIRMVMVVLIQLYTSRIVLQELGVEDYGIYNVVGGIVVMFGSINGSMSSSTQRYITFQLGKNNFEELQSVFRSALQMHILMSFFIFVLAETLGLWLLCDRMVIPDDREHAAMWVYQLSVASFIVSIISVPYNSVIIAHEKMSAFAYISVLEVFLKLLAALLLMICLLDKLVVYAFLLFLIQMLVRSCYAIYCHRHFEETKYIHQVNKRELSSMMKFGGWNMFTNIASILNTQGINILLNVFFGPAVNAARGVAVQVQSYVNQFCNNVQVAVNPEITKSYASGEHSQTIELMGRAGRFSYYILFMITLPLLLEAETILSIWLTEVPKYTATFLRILLCCQLIWTFSGPMTTVAFATGKIVRLNITCGLIVLLALPIAWLLLSQGAPPYIVFIIVTLLEVVSQLSRMFIIRGLISYSIKKYCKDVYLNVLLVSLFSFLVPAVFHFVLPFRLISSIIVCVVALLSVAFFSYFIGLLPSERVFVYNLFSKRICSLKNKWVK